METEGTSGIEETHGCSATGGSLGVSIGIESSSFKGRGEPLSCSKGTRGDNGSGSGCDVVDLEDHQ